MKRLILILTLLGSFVATYAREDADSLADSLMEPAAETVVAGAAEGAAASGATDAAATPEQLWDRANTAYINGDYHGAAELYEALLARGLSSVKLYYNLANSCFKDNQLGKAILFYHRAQRMSPGNDDIRYNLHVAESRTKDKIEQIPEFFLSKWIRDVRHTMSCTAWSIISLVALAAALGLFLLYLLASRMTLRKAGFYGTIVTSLLFVVSSWFALGERREMLDDSQGVVMTSSAAVKSSPDKSATDLFVLHEGTLVEISDRLDGWCEVTISDGKKGWLEARTIETI